MTPGVRYVSVSYVDGHSCEDVSTTQLVVMVDTATVPGMVSGSALITIGFPTDTLIIEGHRGRVVKWQKKFDDNTYADIPATSGLGFGAGLSALVLGSIGIMITPGGIGLYPAIIQETLLLYGVVNTTGLALGWIAWTAQTVMILVVGGLSLILLSFNKTENGKA